MTEEKIYTPETITENPLPGQVADNLTVSSGSSSGDIHTPATMSDIQLPDRQIAKELLSDALNTKTQKILREFAFTPSGAIQIGQFEPNISGDIRISPNGIVARNLNGDTTFAIDGETGDATFKGIIQAADFVIADENGLISLSNFSSGNVTNNVLRNISAVAPFADVPNTSITFSLKRAANVLILLSGDFGYTSVSSNDIFDLYLAINIDGVNYYDTSKGIGDVYGGSIDAGGGANFGYVSAHQYIQLSAGEHTIKLQWRMLIAAGSPVLRVNTTSLTYLVLGT